MNDEIQGGESASTMICPSCGKDTPRGGKFCLHCGEAVTGLIPVPVVAERTPTEWEQDEFVLKWEPGQRPCDEIFRQGEASARIGFWQANQRHIMPDIQKRMDDGWEPVTEVGPGAFVLRHYKSFEGYGCLGWMVMISITISTFGLGLLFIPFMRRDWVEAAEFRVQLRRPEPSETPDGEIVGYGCPLCGDGVPATASACPNCGVSFEGSDAEEEEEHECDQCGTVVPAGESTCPNCGASMGRPVASSRGTEDEHECYQCGTNVPVGALICPNCQAALSDNQPR